MHTPLCWARLPIWQHPCCRNLIAACKFKKKKKKNRNMTLKHCSSGVPAFTNKATTIWNISCPLENTTSRTWDANNEAAQSAATTTRSKQSMWCAVAHKVGWMAAKASMTTQMRFFFSPVTQQQYTLHICWLAVEFNGSQSNNHWHHNKSASRG